MRMQKWTVLGYFEDNGQIWCEHVIASDGDGGVREGLIAIRNRNADMGLDNIAVVGLFKGHQKELFESDSVSYASDILATQEAEG